jgi:hypothetical protein
MALLHIDLQEGFFEDTVAVFVNGNETYRKAGVKTRVQIGLAESLKVEVSEERVQVRVSLPLKNLSEAVEIQVSTDVYLGVSLSRDGKLICRTSGQPFRYL